MNPPKEILGQPGGGPHLRYVEVYSTGGSAPQPVSAKRLKWDGSAFATWGDAFPIGDTTTAGEVAAFQRFWVAWQPDSRRWYPIKGTGAEQLRRIRGQSYGAQSGSTILIDNVVVLAGGLDPSGGNPATQIEVANIYGDSFADNEKVTADYSPAVLTGIDWEANHTVAGTEQFRLLRAAVKGAVTPEANTFTVDGILVRAGGLDPRTVPGDAAEELLVFKDPSDNWHEDLYDNEIVDIVYAPGVFTGCDWELLFVERFREIRGKAYTAYADGTSDIEIDGIVVLGSGRDPRTDPTDATELITVKRPFSQAYADNEDVYAVFRCSTGVWEARKKIAGNDGASGTFVCNLTGGLSAASIAAPSSASATVYSITTGGATTSLGSKTIYSHRDYGLPAGIYYLSKTGFDDYTVINDNIPAWLAAQAGYGSGFGVFTNQGGFTWLPMTCEELVTGVSCVDEEIVGTTATYYVITCSP